MGKRLSDDERLARIKAGLHCSDQEALEVLEYDKRIDKDDKKTEYDLTVSQQKIAAKYTRTGTRKAPTNDNPNKKKERKPNATKAGIVAELGNFLANGSQFAIEELELKNPEREIKFKIDGQPFTLVLTQNRK